MKKAAAKKWYPWSVNNYTPAGKFNQLLGKAFGLGLTQNIEDAYRYVMNTYRPGDRIYLFGFSRGALTVRFLAGMLHKWELWGQIFIIDKWATKKEDRRRFFDNLSRIKI